MNILKVLHKPIITEKTYKLMKQDVYVFEVSLQAEKFDVKRAFESIFDVKVAKVNLIKYHRRPKTVGRFKGYRSGFKKAFITLKQGEKLQLLKEEAEAAQVTESANTEKKQGVFSRFKNTFLKKQSQPEEKTNPEATKSDQSSDQTTDVTPKKQSTPKGAQD